MPVTDTLKNSKKLQPAFTPSEAESLAEVVENAVSTVMDRVDKRMDERFERIDERFERIDERFQHIDERFTALYWVVGSGFGFIGIVAALIAVLLAVK